MYEMPTRCVCHSAAWDSGQSPRIEAAIDAAAERPPVMARCTPDEKRGSMKAATMRLRFGYNFAPLAVQENLPAASPAIRKFSPAYDDAE